MTFKSEVSQADAQWVLEHVVPKAGYRIDHSTLSMWKDAHNKVFEEQVGIPGCSCEYVQTMKIWQSRISQYDSHIKEIAYPPAVLEIKTKKKVAK
jgi:hypothetical protein